MKVRLYEMVFCLHVLFCTDEISRWVGSLPSLLQSTILKLSVVRSCMDASIAIKPVFERFQTVIITSGVKLSFSSLSSVKMLQVILRSTLFLMTLLISCFQDTLSFGYLSPYSGFPSSHHGIVYNDTGTNLSLSPGK